MIVFSLHSIGSGRTGSLRGRTRCTKNNTIGVEERQSAQMVPSNGRLLTHWKLNDLLMAVFFYPVTVPQEFWSVCDWRIRSKPKDTNHGDSNQESEPCAYHANRRNTDLYSPWRNDQLQDWSSYYIQIWLGNDKSNRRVWAIKLCGQCFQGK